MTSEKCKTCGLSDIIHNRVCGEFIPTKPIEEEVERYDVVYADLTKEEREKLKEKQGEGCGKEYEVKEKEDREFKYFILCMEGQLCPECSNQSPERVRTESLSDSSVSLDKDTPVDTTNRNEAGTNTLSSKIFRHPDFPYQEDAKFIYVKDVKTFIKDRNKLDMLLRKKKITWNDYVDERNKLAGSELLVKGEK